MLPLAGAAGQRQSNNEAALTPQTRNSSPFGTFQPLSFPPHGLPTTVIPTLSLSLPSPPPASYYAGVQTAPTPAPLFKRQHRRRRQTKEACKQDLNSCAFFVELNGSAPGPPAHQNITPYAPAISNTRLGSGDAAHNRPSSSPQDDLDDPISEDCKPKVDFLKATLDGTFISSQATTRNFENECRAAESAFSEAKVVIREAAAHLKYLWAHEEQSEKRGCMLEAQISLGRRIREAYRKAMDRKEKILIENLVEEQMAVGSVEMGHWLDGLDRGWFEEPQEDLETD